MTNPFEDLSKRRKAQELTVYQSEQAEKAKKKRAMAYDSMVTSVLEKLQRAGYPKHEIMSPSYPNTDASGNDEYPWYLVEPTSEYPIQKVTVTLVFKGEYPEKF